MPVKPQLFTFDVDPTYLPSLPPLSTVLADCVFDITDVAPDPDELSRRETWVSLGKQGGKMVQAFVTDWLMTRYPYLKAIHREMLLTPLLSLRTFSHLFHLYDLQPKVRRDGRHVRQPKKTAQALVVKACIAALFRGDAAAATDPDASFTTILPAPWPGSRTYIFLGALFNEKVFPAVPYAVDHICAERPELLRAQHIDSIRHAAEWYRNAEAARTIDRVLEELDVIAVEVQTVF